MGKNQRKANCLHRQNQQNCQLGHHTQPANCRVGSLIHLWPAWAWLVQWTKPCYGRNKPAWLELGPVQLAWLIWPTNLNQHMPELANFLCRQPLLYQHIASAGLIILRCIADLGVTGIIHSRHVLNWQFAVMGIVINQFLAILGVTEMLCRQHYPDQHIACFDILPSGAFFIYRFLAPRAFTKIICYQP